MRALVTGGAGFIGSHLVDSLRSDGHSVVVLDDLSTGRIENLIGHNSEAEAEFELVVGSILDAPLVDKLTEPADIIFHLAAAVGVRNIVDDPLGGLRTNVRGTEFVLEAAHRHRRRVVMASTSEIYGKSPRVPMAEDDDRVLGSTAVHRWSYSTAKAVDEHLAFALAMSGLQVTALRYFNVYGPRMDPRGYGSVVATFLGQAQRGDPLTVHGDGRQCRCFTWIDDAVAATRSAGEGNAALGLAVNVGNPSNEISMEDLALLVRRVTGVDVPVRHVSYAVAYGPGFEDTPRRVPAVERAHRVLGWSPTVDLADGLLRTWRWSREPG